MIPSYLHVHYFRVRSLLFGDFRDEILRLQHTRQAVLVSYTERVIRVGVIAGQN